MKVIPKTGTPWMHDIYFFFFQNAQLIAAMSAPGSLFTKSTQYPVAPHSITETLHGNET